MPLKAQFLQITGFSSLFKFIVRLNFIFICIYLFLFFYNVLNTMLSYIIFKSHIKNLYINNHIDIIFLILDLLYFINFVLAKQLRQYYTFDLIYFHKFLLLLILIILTYLERWHEVIFIMSSQKIIIIFQNH